MRTVSRVRKSIVWIFKLLFERQLKAAQRESDSVSPCSVHSFTRGGPCLFTITTWDFPTVQKVKNLPAMQETPL